VGIPRLPDSYRHRYHRLPALTKPIGALRRIDATGASNWTRRRGDVGSCGVFYTGSRFQITLEASTGSKPRLLCFACRLRTTCLPGALSGWAWQVPPSSPMPKQSGSTPCLPHRANLVKQARRNAAFRLGIVPDASGKCDSAGPALFDP
jgi:hypothetical protein